MGKLRGIWAGVGGWEPENNLSQEGGATLDGPEVALGANGIVSKISTIFN